MNPREVLVVTPLTGYGLEVGAALWRLDDARDRTMRVLAGVSDVDLDRAGSPNSVGTILYHVALIEADWLFTEILERDLPAELAALFPVEHRDVDGVLSVISGESLAQHLARLATVRDALKDELRTVDSADFHRARHLDAYDVTPEWVLHHLAQHEAEHRAEMGSALRSLRASPSP